MDRGKTKTGQTSNSITPAAQVRRAELALDSGCGYGDGQAALSSICKVGTTGPPNGAELLCCESRRFSSEDNAKQ